MTRPLWTAGKSCLPESGSIRKKSLRKICNIVFDDGASFGNLRWSQEDLKKPGEWYYTRLGHGVRYEKPSQWPMWGNGTLYVCCPQNPASVYASIELVCWGDRMAVTSGGLCGDRACYDLKKAGSMDFPGKKAITSPSETAVSA